MLLSWLVKISESKNRLMIKSFSMKYLITSLLVICSFGLVLSQDCDPRVVITRGIFHAGWNEYFTVENSELVNIPISDISVYQESGSYDYDLEDFDVSKIPMKITRENGKYVFSATKVGRVHIDFKYNDSLYQYEFKIHPMPVKARLSKYGASLKRNNK